MIGGFYEYSTMLQHGDSRNRGLTPHQPASSGLPPHHLMRPAPITRKWKSRLEAG
ncbi:MAG: hypothetical protein ACQEQ0_03865 [Bacteroidota bacterium]